MINDKYFQYAKNIRHRLHQYPETGYDLDKTLEIITNELNDMKIDYYYLDSASSIIATISSNANYTIAFRADIDALAIEEDNDLPFKSLNKGKMHACGHDIHASILLGTLKYLKESNTELKCNIKAIFQAAEEGPTSGGRRVVQSGLVDDVNMFYALHVAPQIETGKVLLKENEFNAGCSDFSLEIVGKSGHGAYPQYAIDPIQIGNEIYMAIQLMKAREIDQSQKAVISICSMNAGNNQTNVIPDKLTMVGTVRTYNKDLDKTIENKLKNIISGITSIHNGKYNFSYINDCIPLINDVIECQKLKKVFSNTLGKENVLYSDFTSMGTDDFAFYSDYKKGVMFYLGVRNEKEGCIHSLHSSKFKACEEAIKYGIECYISIILNQGEENDN